MPALPPLAPPADLVYLVEDSVELLELYEIVLGKMGCRSKGFRSSEQALKEMPALPRPLLLIVDFSLPGLDGEGFVGALRTLIPDISQTTYILGFSNHRPQVPLVAGFQKIIDLYLEKPFDVTDFTQKIQTVLNGAIPTSLRNALGPND